ncbi:phytoene desaturase family protein [Nakamurella deserti]|uniref:phytoene desaturase family protein n=1 Tax=Nakamurella deserti TaxID=2164074 RepID=UPI000DBEA937|nr:NAD(P)/FAD-dependent oxidoreductase [Nakamurella deserti]
MSDHAGSTTTSDVVVVGAGHNGLVAAILAAQAGLSVTVLERNRAAGGATTGAAVFPGHSARVSRYSYLVSLFPDELVARLGISLPLASRAVSSFTPVIRGGRADGLLVEAAPGAATEESFRRVTGTGEDHAAWREFYDAVARMAEIVAPVLTGPLRRRRQVRDHVVSAAGAALWDDLVERPLGEAITRRFRDDTVRGVVATDGLIGTHTSLFDESLLANRCFLYHVIGRGTGEWSVPVGGMGAVTDALLDRAQRLGVRLVLDAPVVGVDETADGVTVTAEGAVPGDHHGRHVLAAVAPAVVDGWRGRSVPGPVGAQLKINLLLSRLPRLASGMDPRVAFAGTTHLEEGFGQLEDAYTASVAGTLPEMLPGEVYCHSLTDPSILGGTDGATLTLFGLHTPVGMFRGDDGRREAAVSAAVASLQRHLAEPLEDCLALDDQGRPCVDVATPADLEQSLGMPGGHIFHGDLTWPWQDDDVELAGPAERHGVAVPGSRRILLAGAGTRRGGGVSGLGGLAAVDALLDVISDMSARR